MYKFKDQSNTSQIRRIWLFIGSKRRKQFCTLFLLTLVCTVFEVINLGAVVPFIRSITNPRELMSSDFTSNLFSSIGVSSESEIVIFISFVFALTAIISGVLRLVLLWFSVKIGSLTGAELSVEIYRRTLYQPYRVHVARNSSEVISGMTQKVDVATSVLVSATTVVTYFIIAAAIIGLVIALNPVAALIVITCFGSAYLLVTLMVRRKLISNGKTIAQGQTKIVRALQEGLGAIRDVLLDGTQGVYCNIYQDAIVQLRSASGNNLFLNQAPRYAMESFGILVIVVSVVYLSKSSHNIVSNLPFLATLGMAAQRLLPLMQQIYGNWAVVIGGKAVLGEVIELLNQTLPTDVLTSGGRDLTFKKSIEFKDVWFKYEERGEYVLKGLSFIIPKGAHVGIIGATGCGKSTVIDLLAGLLLPTKGEILIDGNVLDEQRIRSWQKNVSHVPQTIFLSDATIAENIAFGIPDIDIKLENVEKYAKMAQLSDLISSRNGGFSAVVGERGLLLSGGQRQRIGIARALYKEASVIILDEATNALDEQTELQVMKSVYNIENRPTLFIVSHRLSAIKNCDFFIKIANSIAVKCSRSDAEQL